jgi:hypothetical protein
MKLSANDVRDLGVLLSRRWRLKRICRRNAEKDLDFEFPITIAEKTQFRKLYGNHKTYAALADKYNVRHYVRETIGEEYLIPLLGVFRRLDRSVFRHLPDCFIMKATHGSKWNKIVWDKRDLHADRIARSFNRKLRRKYSSKSGEYHYDLIEPKVVAEKLLVDGDGPPWDYCFFCYNPPSGFDYALTIQSPDQKQTMHFDDHLRYIEGSCSAGRAADALSVRNFDEMVAVARKLSRGFDFVRIDLYNMKGRVYFGEMTFTPASGFGKIANRTRRELRDSMWILDETNPNLYNLRLLHLARRFFRNQKAAFDT